MRPFLVAILVLAAASAAGTQQPRDSAGASPAAGTASIAGTVVARDSGALIRGARVALTAAGQPTVVVTAGDDGTFRFAGLPPGAYRVWGARSGYIPAAYGEKRPGSGLPGPWIALEAGQHRDQLKLQLPRGGIITGTVLEASGEPAIGSMVMALRVMMQKGRKTFVPTSMQEVNDRGVYRVHSLPPGEYVVAAVSLGGVGLSEMLGSGPGMMGARQAPVELLAPGGGDQNAMSASATFYPQTPRMVDAGRVDLGAGEERAGVDIRVVRESGVRVAGTVRGAERAGMFEGSSVVQLRAKDDVDLLPVFSGQSTMVRNGAFEFARVPPGQYELTATRRGMGGDPRSTEWATQEVNVAGTSVDGLVLTFEPAVSVSATIEADMGQLPQRESMLSLLFRQDEASAGFDREASPGQVQNGQFATRLKPGRYILDVAGLSGWRPKSAMFGSIDALDFPVEVKTGEDLVGRVILTASTTEISGSLEGTLDPATNYSVIAFAADERYWRPEGRRNVAAEVDSKRHFSIKDLPAGRYRLAVVEDFDSLAGVYPELLRRIAPTATTDVTLRDGDALVQNVRIK